MRFAAAALAAVLGSTSSAHLLLDPTHCAELTTTDAAMRECHQAAMAQPAWVAHFPRTGSGPEQVHINYGSSPSAMTVSWAHNVTASTPALEWGLAAGNRPNKV